MATQNSNFKKAVTIYEDCLSIIGEFVDRLEAYVEDRKQMSQTELLAEDVPTISHVIEASEIKALKIKMNTILKLIKSYPDDQPFNYHLNGKFIEEGYMKSVTNTIDLFIDVLFSRLKPDGSINDPIGAGFVKNLYDLKDMLIEISTQV